MANNIVVRRTGRTFSVFVEISANRMDLIEGGFFTRHAAENAATEWRKFYATPKDDRCISCETGVALPDSDWCKVCHPLAMEALGGN